MVKDGTASQLAQAVRRTAAGLRVVDSVLAEEAKWQGSSPLTGRETEVLRAAETAGASKKLRGCSDCLRERYATTSRRPWRR